MSATEENQRLRDLLSKELEGLDVEERSKRIMQVTFERMPMYEVFDCFKRDKAVVKMRSTRVQRIMEGLAMINHYYIELVNDVHHQNAMNPQQQLQDQRALHSAVNKMLYNPGYGIKVHDDVKGAASVLMANHVHLAMRVSEDTPEAPDPHLPHGRFEGMNIGEYASYHQPCHRLEIALMQHGWLMENHELKECLPAADDTERDLPIPTAPEGAPPASPPASPPGDGDGGASAEQEEPSIAERMQRLDDNMEKIKQEACAKLGIEEPPGAKPAEAPPVALPEPDVEAEIDEHMRKQKEEDMDGHIIGEMPVDFVCGCGCYGGRGWLYVPGQCDSCYQQWGPDGRDEPGPEPEPEHKPEPEPEPADAETAAAGYEGGSALPGLMLPPPVPLKLDVKGDLEPLPDDKRGRDDDDEQAKKKPKPEKPYSPPPTPRVYGSSRYSSVRPGEADPIDVQSVNNPLWTIKCSDDRGGSKLRTELGMAAEA